jgi:hypothetical protein
MTAPGPASAAPPPALRARTLHLTNGDVAAALLRESGLPGAIAVYADVLYEGPALPGLSPPRWRRSRALYLAACGYEGYEQCLARLTGWDRAVEQAREYEEVVLWMEPDLFDQLLLLRLLCLLDEERSPFTTVSLLSSTDGADRFVAFGHLSPEQLAALIPRRQPLGKAAFAIARAAWDAFTAPAPTGLLALLQLDTAPLPFLALALLRHLEEFPAVANGLSRTEQQVLRTAMEAAKPLAFDELFRRTQSLEERPYMTDLSLLRHLRHLASGPRPLLRLENVRHGLGQTLTVAATAAAVEVLAGREDWIDLRGIDRWLGGVQLAGSEAAWRWDGARSRLVGR